MIGKLKENGKNISSWSIVWLFRHMVFFVLLPYLDLILITLNWWLNSGLNDIYLSINMFWTPRFTIYVFTLVGAFISKWQCRWMNPIIRTLTTFFFLILNALWYGTKPVLWIFYSLSSQLPFQWLLFYWWKADVCWPKICSSSHQSMM